MNLIMCAAELFQMVADDYMLNPENARRVEETIMLNAHDKRRSCCLVSSWDHSFTTQCLGVCTMPSHNSHMSLGQSLWIYCDIESAWGLDFFIVWRFKP